MTVYAFSRLPAFNPNTNPASVAKSATGSVYDIGDTGFLTPLNLTLVATNTVTTTLISDANGMFPDFTLDSRTQCAFKSGTQVFILTTTTPIAGPTGPTSTVPGPPGPATTDASLLAAGTVADARLPTRLQDTALNATYGPAEPGVTAWAASTVYAAGNIVRNPQGHVVTVLTAHTSTSTYDSSKFTTPLGYMPFGGTPVTTVVKQNGDTRPGVWEMIHDSGTGYLFHLMTGTNAATASALIGLGIDNGGQGIFINNKKTGQGINIQQNDTITSATAYAIYASQLSTVAPLIHIDQASGTQASLRIVTSETTDDLKEGFKFIAPGSNKGGAILAKTGNIFWFSDIVTHDGGKMRVRALQTDQNNNQAMIESSALRLATYTGSTDQFWHKRVTGSGQSMLFQSSDTLAGGPDASVTWVTGLEIKQVSGISAGTQIGFYGATPIARQAAITAPTAPSAAYVQAEATAMKTAVDAIRTALTGIGITF